MGREIPPDQKNFCAYQKLDIMYMDILFKDGLYSSTDRICAIHEKIIHVRALNTAHSVVASEEKY